MSGTLKSNVEFANCYGDADEMEGSEKFSRLVLCFSPFEIRPHMLFVESNVLTDDERRRGVPAFERDFILLAEFCEQRGPVPIVAWPPNNGHQRFDLDKFVVRILASDASRRYDSKGIGLGGWNTPEDTEGYLTDISQNAHAYVHHFTLHDLQARGYVRPLCLCYITRESSKIFDNFPELLAAFRRISHSLKYGNNCIFISDIWERLMGVSKLLKMDTSSAAALLGLHQQQQSEQHQANENTFTEATAAPGDEPRQQIAPGYPELTEEVFDSVLAELQDLQSRFLAHIAELEKSELEHTPGDASLLSEIAEPLGSILAKDVNPLHLNGFVEPVSRTAAAAATFPSGKPVARNPAADFSQLYEQGLSAASPNLQKYMPMVLKTIHKSSNFEQSLRDVTVICSSKVFDAASVLVRDILEHFSRPSLVLQLEKDDLRTMATRDTPSLLFIGRNLVMDFNLERETQTSTSSPAVPPVLPRMDSYLASAHLLSVASVSSSDPPSELSNDITEDYKDAMEEYVDSEIDSEMTITRMPMSARSEPTTPVAAPCAEQQQQQPSRQQLALLRKNVMFKNGYNGCYISHVLEDQVELTAVPYNTPRLPGRGVLISCEFYSFTKEMVYSLLTGRLLIIHGQVEHEQYVRNLVAAFSIFLPGQAWIKQKQPDAASNENSQASLDHIGDDAVQPWRTKPISIQDLASLKLVGLSKRVAVPRHLEPYVSRLDLEKSVLYAPPYRGQFLDRMFNRRKSWPDESSFLAWVHSMFLRIATKAAVFHHIHTMNHSTAPAPNPRASTSGPSALNKAGFTTGGSFTGAQPMFLATKVNRGRSVSNPPLLIRVGAGNRDSISSSTNSEPAASQQPQSPQSSRVLPKRIMARLGVKGSDIDIVEYLSSVILEQESRAVMHSLPRPIILHPYGQV